MITFVIISSLILLLGWAILKAYENGYEIPEDWPDEEPKKHTRNNAKTYPEGYDVSEYGYSCTR